MTERKEPVTQKGDSDIQQRIGTSPRLVGSISVYLDKSGKYRVNTGTMASDRPAWNGKNAKEVIAHVTKFLTAELENDQFDDGEEE